MNIKELHQLNPAKLVDALKKVRRELAVKRFHLATGQGKSTADIKSDRKSIAQILTLLNNQK